MTLLLADFPAPGAGVPPGLQDGDTVVFYGDSITYPDNTVEQVAFSILPYPIFSGGEKIAIQRGAGMLIASSTPEKEYAAALKK